MTYSSNTYLLAYGNEMKANANYIYSFFKSKGWTKQSICAMLGNMQRESTINPGLWYSLKEGDTSVALGLVQWYPASKLINWCNSKGYDYLSIEAQCNKIMDELNNGGQWIATSDYPETFKEFTNSTKSIEYLTYAFLKNYERADVDAASERVEHANYWFNHLESVSYNFTPRLTSDGMEGNPYWYSKNPFYQAGYGLPNCTTYAWGRFWEISDISKDYTNRPKLSTGNAGEWFYYTSDGYERGTTPKLGAVICWSDNTGGAGHVGIVEEILDNGDIVVSQSGWGSSYFWTNTKLASQGYSYNNYTFQGFIYNPYVVINPDDSGSSITKKHKYKFVLFNRRLRNGQR